MRLILTDILVLVVNFLLLAQEKSNSQKWFEKIHIGGYTQVRYNGLLETNPDLGCEQCDENWGEDGGGLSFRRLP